MASLATAASSIADLLRRRAAATPRRIALDAPLEGGGWASTTWSELEARVRAVAAGMLDLGLAPGERCAIVATTSVEWIVADLGILSAAGVSTTVDPTSSEDECAYILGDSETRIAFVEDEAQVAKIAARRKQLPALGRVVVIGPGAVFDPRGGWAMSLADLERRGRVWSLGHPRALDAVIDGIDRSRIATLIYTSGTTGKPKGVELRHEGWLYEAGAIEALGIVGPNDHQLLWLPLAHAFGRLLEVAQIAIGLRSSVDDRISQLAENLASVEPTFMAGPPRVLEKIQHGVLSTVTAKGGITRRLFEWGLRVGREMSVVRQRGAEPDTGLVLRHRVADRLVLRRVRARFGRNLRFLVSGGAPLPREIAELFHAIGVVVLEGYGLTEASAASTVNRPERCRLGTVGLPLPGTAVRIAVDGEVLIRGPGVMRKYHDLPQQSLDALSGGWLHTGDIGEIDPDGFLRITGRKKDLIETGIAFTWTMTAIEA